MAIFESTRDPLPRAFGVSVAIHVLLVVVLLGLSRLEPSRNLMGEAGLDVPTVALLGLEGSPDGGGGASAPAAAPDPTPKAATPVPTPEPVKSTPIPEPTRPPATPEPKVPEPKDDPPAIESTPEPTPEVTPLATIAVPQATKRAETPKPSPTADKAAERKKAEEEKKKAEEKKLADAKKKADEEKKKKADAEKAAAEKAAAEKKKAAEVALAPSTARTLRPGQGVTVRDPKGGAAAKKEGALGPGEGGKDGKKGDGAKAPGGTAGGKAFGRADGHALGTAAIGSNVLRGVGLPDYYCKNALAQLSRHFVVPPDRQADKTAVVEFRILRSGELTGIRVKRSSGDAELDQLALDAMKKAGKLAPLPDAVEKDSIETEVAFNFLE